MKPCEVKPGNRFTVRNAKERAEIVELSKILDNMAEYYRPMYIDEARRELSFRLLDMTPDELIQLAVDVAACKN